MIFSKIKEFKKNVFSSTELFKDCLAEVETTIEIWPFRFLKGVHIFIIFQNRSDLRKSIHTWENLNGYGCLDLRFEEIWNLNILSKSWMSNVYICDLKENENVNTFEKSERSDFIGGFQLR